MKYQNQASEKIISEIFSQTPKPQVLETIRMIKQQNLDQFPDQVPAGILKEQQKLLELIEYLFSSFTSVEKDS